MVEDYQNDGTKLRFVTRGIRWRSAYIPTTSNMSIIGTASRTLIPRTRFLRRTYSEDSAGLKVTYSNILSDENKQRCRKQLLSVKPARSIPWDREDKLRKAAVLVPLIIHQGAPSFLFTLRSQNLFSYRGHVSFPGGKKDETDPDIVHTALREMQEEVGIEAKQVDVWGQTLPVPSKDFEAAVYPVIGFCGEVDTATLKLNAEEVEKVFVQTVESLCNPANTHYTRFRTGKGYVLPVYTGGEHRIWGLTAIILHQVLTLMAPGLYNFSFQQR